MTRSGSNLLADLQQPAGASALAGRALRFMEEIYPICRSITGAGVRTTLDLVGRHVPLERSEVASGTPVFDWEVPNEWNIRDAYVADASGRRVIDFRRHSLHVLNYSTPVRARMTLAELRPHLYAIPEHPDWIPYRTSYWREHWAFCITQKQYDALAEGEYEVVIDSELKPGTLTYAECRVRGETAQEFLLFTHICHPSLANDNASGIAIATLIARELLQARPRLSYRIVFAPATIGSITWLARNAEAARRLRGGLVIGLLGDAGPLTYKRSRRGNSEIDLIANGVVRAFGPEHRTVDFSPYGYDERQFCSPGFDLAVGRLTRTPNGEYPEYHTSADNLEFMRVESLAQSVQAIATILAQVDSNRRFHSLAPACEPRLGKRGLFRSTGGSSPREFEFAILWLLNQADGTHGLNDVAAASGLSLETLAAAADALVQAGLIEEVATTAAQSRPADHGHLEKQ